MQGFFPKVTFKSALDLTLSLSLIPAQKHTHRYCSTDKSPLCPCISKWPVICRCECSGLRWRPCALLQEEHSLITFVMSTTTYLWSQINCGRATYRVTLTPFWLDQIYVGFSLDVTSNFYWDNNVENQSSILTSNLWCQQSNIWLWKLKYMKKR